LGKLLKAISLVLTPNDVKEFNDAHGYLSYGNNAFEYILCSRNNYEVLDIAKVADVIVYAFSCKSADVSNWKKDPDNFAHAIDERGYEILSMI